MGVQGALLTAFLDDQLPLVPITSIVVTRDARLQKPPEQSITGSTSESQLVALERAIPNRARAILTALNSETSRKLNSTWQSTPPTVYITSHTFTAGKSMMAVVGEPQTAATATNNHHDGDGTTLENRKRKRDGQQKSRNPTGNIVPCGVSINWNEADARIITKESENPSLMVEVLVGARGIKQGKKPRTPKDYANLASRLSRSHIVQDFVLRTTADRQITVDHNLPSKMTYHKLKEETACQEWLKTKEFILKCHESPLVGWIRSAQEDDDFIVDRVLPDSK
jgi:Adenosine-deaminase (editase) domain